MSFRVAILVLGSFLFGCAADERQTFQTDMLKTVDCDIGLVAYRQLLTLPAHAGVVVTGRPPEIPSPEAQEQAAIEFAGVCHYQLAGRVRRPIIRCWADSLDVTTFRRCSERF